MQTHPAQRTALITDVQRFSIHDGPGIRTTIFFKGCPLTCKWCHNPETIHFKNELMFKSDKCILCKDCIAGCPKDALLIKNNTLQLERARCDSCLLCAPLCPSEALEPAAKNYTAKELLCEVLSDFDYYGTGKNSGGITISGGEPLSQKAFLSEFLPMAKRESLHVCAQTSAYWNYNTIHSLIQNIDLFLIDVKAMDNKRHLELTGRPVKLIHTNIQKLLKEKKEVHIRMPVIQGLNDDEKNLTMTKNFLKELGITTITLLPYHSFGENKSTMLGKHAQYSKQSMSATTLRARAVSDYFESHHITVRSS